MSKWYRVIDPLSPLFGCDLRLSGHSVSEIAWAKGVKFAEVTALRRVDIFVGDRPFQLVAPDGGNLGLMIDMDQLDDSPIQVETMETGVDRPFGLCIDESEMTRPDGYTLRIARYERAAQVALDDPEGVLLATRTFVPNDTGIDWTIAGPNMIVEMFAREGDPDEIVSSLKGRN